MMNDSASKHAIVYAIRYAIDIDYWQNNDILNIVVKNHLREVGELLRRAYITKDSILCVENCSEG